MSDPLKKTFATREREKRQSFVEYDHAQVEGIDLSGHWNRMFEPREIIDYDLTHLDALTALPSAESMG